MRLVLLEAKTAHGRNRLRLRCPNGLANGKCSKSVNCSRPSRSVGRSCLWHQTEPSNGAVIGFLDGWQSTTTSILACALTNLAHRLPKAVRVERSVRHGATKGENYESVDDVRGGNGCSISSYFQHDVCDADVFKCNYTDNPAHPEARSNVRGDGYRGWNGYFMLEGLSV